MAYQRKTKTAAELSEACRRAALSRKNKRGGRPKGWTKDPALKTLPPKTLTVREPDYQVYLKCAFAANVSIVEFMHMNAEGLKKRNPQLFDQKNEITVNP